MSRFHPIRKYFESLGSGLSIFGVNYHFPFDKFQPILGIEELPKDPRLEGCSLLVATALAAVLTRGYQSTDGKKFAPTINQEYKHLYKIIHFYKSENGESKKRALNKLCSLVKKVQKHFKESFEGATFGDSAEKLANYFKVNMYLHQTCNGDKIVASTSFEKTWENIHLHQYINSRGEILIRFIQLFDLFGRNHGFFCFWCGKMFSSTRNYKHVCRSNAYPKCQKCRRFLATSGSVVNDTNKHEWCFSEVYPIKKKTCQCGRDFESDDCFYFHQSTLCKRSYKSGHEFKSQKTTVKIKGKKKRKTRLREATKVCKTNTSQESELDFLCKTSLPHGSDVRTFCKTMHTTSELKSVNIFIWCQICDKSFNEMSSLLEHSQNCKLKDKLQPIFGVEELPRDHRLNGCSLLVATALAAVLTRGYQSKYSKRTAPTINEEYKHLYKIIHCYKSETKQKKKRALIKLCSLVKTVQKYFNESFEGATFANSAEKLTDYFKVNMYLHQTDNGDKIVGSTSFEKTRENIHLHQYVDSSGEIHIRFIQHFNTFQRNHGFFCFWCQNHFCPQSSHRHFCKSNAYPQCQKCRRFLATSRTVVNVSNKHEWCFSVVYPSKKKICQCGQDFEEDDCFNFHQKMFCKCSLKSGQKFKSQKSTVKTKEKRKQKTTLHQVSEEGPYLKTVNTSLVSSSMNNDPQIQREANDLSEVFVTVCDMKTFTLKETFSDFDLDELDASSTWFYMNNVE